jgi:hypothetical protein
VTSIALPTDRSRIMFRYGIIRKVRPAPTGEQLAQSVRLLADRISPSA